MTDVARLAGVSHQTVSRVINDHPSVRPETRQRVRVAMAQLGYRPNRAARALARGQSDQIGIVAEPSTLFGPSSLLHALEAAAAEVGYGVSVVSVVSLDRQSFGDAVNRHLEQRVGGIIVIVPVISAAEATREVPAGVPLVTIGGDPARSSRCVRIDQLRGATEATQLLLDAGHRTVWHVSGPPDNFDSIDRMTGWRTALERVGAQVPPVITGDWSSASGYRAGTMLARIEEVTAIFAANDQMALGVLRALHENGRAVPRDVSIVGFDDLPESGDFIPPLTTIRQDFDAVGRRALALLVAQMQGAESPLSEVIAPTVILRDSVAAPPPTPA